MKNKILDELMKTDKYISGEVLSNLCGISRTAIWKQIKHLQQEGYRIESQHGGGYRLIDPFDILNEREFLAGLKLDNLSFEPKIYCYQEVTSTNIVAKQLVQQGESANGLIVVAETQTMGKGRLGREWASTTGSGLWCSMVLAPPMALVEASRFAFIAAVAITEAIRAVAGIDAQIKWPNDIVYEGKKLCGILIEMVAEAEHVAHFILGFGVNVNQDKETFPEEIREKASSLYLLTGTKIDRMKLLQNILYTLNNALSVYNNQGFAPIKEKWLEYACLLGEEIVIVNQNKKIFSGIFIGIDNDGALMATAENGGVERFLAGDVSLRNSENGYC